MLWGCCDDNDDDEAAIFAIVFKSLYFSVISAFTILHTVRYIRYSRARDSNVYISKVSVLKKH